MLTHVFLHAEQELSDYICLKCKWGVSPLTPFHRGAEGCGVGCEGSFGSLPPGTALDDGEKRAKHTPNVSFQKRCVSWGGCCSLGTWYLEHLKAVGLQLMARPWCSQ